MSPIRTIVRVLALVLAGALSACGSAAHRPAEMRAAEPIHAAADRSVGTVAQRLLVKHASLEIRADDVADVSARAQRLAREMGGYVESNYVDERVCNMHLRVEVGRLEEALAQLERLGDVRERRVTADDVTEQAIDLDARLANLVALRDRLRSHLEKATTSAEAVAVEKELAWAQGEVESLDARLKHLRSSAALSEISFVAERPRILGPVGYVGYGLWWVVEKLFVIR